MRKLSLLTAGVMGAFSMTAATIAFADTSMESTYCKPGFYVGVQAGQGNTGYDDSHLLGPARTDYNSSANNGNPYLVSSSFSNQEVDKIGMSGRMFAGYQFNPYFALETGYTQFNKTDFSANSSFTYENVGVPHKVGIADRNYQYQYKGELTQHAIDLVAKGTLPMPYGFGAYVDAGMAYIASDRHTNVYGPLNTGYSSEWTVDTASYQAFRPTYGAGIDYTIPNTPVDVQAFYQGISGTGEFENTHLWGLGVSYKFA